VSNNRVTKASLVIPLGREYDAEPARRHNRRHAINPGFLSDWEAGVSAASPANAAVYGDSSATMSFATRSAT
jgi:hypothetical protein